MPSNFNREIEIKKQKKLYEKEQKRYKEEINKNPNYKLAYHIEHHL